MRCETGYQLCDDWMSSHLAFWRCCLSSLAFFCCSFLCGLALGFFGLCSLGSLGLGLGRCLLFLHPLEHSEEGGARRVEVDHRVNASARTREAKGTTRWHSVVEGGWRPWRCQVVQLSRRLWGRRHSLHKRSIVGKAAHLFLGRSALQHSGGSSSSSRICCCCCGSGGGDSGCSCGDSGCTHSTFCWVSVITEAALPLRPYTATRHGKVSSDESVVVGECS